MDKKYVITDGINYIKVQDERYPKIVNNILFATTFDGLNANFYLNTNRMKTFLKDTGVNFHVKEVENFPEFNEDENNIHYIITDGTYYIEMLESGKYDVTKNRKSARKFTETKANNVLKMIPKHLRDYKWKIKTYIEPVEVPKESTVIRYDDLVTKTLKNMSNWEECINKLKDYLMVIDDEINNIYDELMDIEHAAEFFNLDMYGGWKLYKQLQDARKRRRKLKDEKIVIEYILQSNFEDCTEKSINKLIKRLENRNYYPRVLQELFNN